ncbi:MAG: glycosyltransferase family 39 protein [Candidatus Omnitrophica bacterium]|nr:glycosyltransferase family 39 protein [Candidatus Omnitrophota bacterium]
MLSRIFIDNGYLSFLERFFINFGLGAGLTGLIILYVGLLGILYKWLIIIMLIFLFVMFIKDIRIIIKDIILWLRSFVNAHFSPLERFLIFSLAFVWFFTLIGSLSPLLGMDAASYHIQDPKIFIKAHKVFYLPYTRESLWPFLVQMLFTLGLLLKGVMLAKLFHFAFSIFSVLGIYVFCRRYWPRANSLMAGAIFALIPAIFTGTTYAYTDLGVVFYTILAFYRFFLWLDTKNNKWFYLSAAACGFLLGIKITSAVTPAIILFLYFFNKVRENKTIKEKFLPVIIFTLIILATGGVWYMRSWIILGNPIFPFAAYLFNGAGYMEEKLRYQLTSGIGTGPVQFIKMLWPLTLYPDRFGGESIGAIFLIFLPMIIFVRKISKFIKYVIFITVSLYASWFIVYQYVRFFYPTLIFLSILVSYIYFNFCKKDKIISKTSTVVIILLFCYSAALSVYHNLDKIPVVFGVQKQQDYLLKHERIYEIAQYVNNNLPVNSKILILAEPRLYYFNRDSAVATLIEMDYMADKNIKNKQSFEEYLRSQGFGNYMLYMKDYSRNGCPDTPLTAQNLFVGYDKKLLKETEFVYRDEHYVYQLWKIGDKNKN